VNAILAPTFRNRVLNADLVFEPSNTDESQTEGLGASESAKGAKVRYRNDDWLAKFEGRVQFHFTPTSASWLNQIEIVFSLLQRKTLNGASFKTKDQLREAIEAFIRRHNERAKPFRWRKREVKGSQLRNTVVNLRN
jgi:hypothetical protein